MLKRLVFSAALSGLVVGLVITALQTVTLIPMILEAETMESASVAGHAHGHVHDHSHDASEWAPADGFERTLVTAMTNVIAAIGFALLLATCFMFKGDIDWRKGELWGLGGFAAFQLAPSLGLPPELPGTEAAALESRQVWWLATALATGGGLLLLASTKVLIWRAAGLLLIAAPHLLGAPQPVEHSALAPQALVSQFVIATTVVGAVFWILLGMVTAYTHKKLAFLG